MSHYVCDYPACLTRGCDKACNAAMPATAAQIASAAEHDKRNAEQTRSQKLAAAGFKRRPTWRSLPSDE